MKSFNLITEPWIKVVEISSGHEKKVSLEEIFRNAQNYLCLSGEMKSQDLSILRLLLAILTTVYTRVDAEGNPYEWIELDDNFRFVRLVDDYDEDDVLDTWEDLYEQGHFSEAVVAYLKKNEERFDFFGEHPFYQVSEREWNETKKTVNGKETEDGTVIGIRQINRCISESGNSPSLFSPRSFLKKDDIVLDELIRWIIMYQDYTGTTDKAKISMQNKVSNSAGWLYKLSPVYANGNNLFETMMLNMVLINECDHGEYVNQFPIWEYCSISKYIEDSKKMLVPDNIAALYTNWSRLINIVWENEKPIIHVAGLPVLDNSNAFVEPMTVWKKNKDDFVPAIKSIKSNDINKAMWRDFGMYVNVNSDNNEDEQPGIVSWLKFLKDNECIKKDMMIDLSSVFVINDGNATSQMPALEISDDMSIKAEVLFDNSINYWPKRIEDIISSTQKIGNEYNKLTRSIGMIRFNDSGRASAFAKKRGSEFYAKLNSPFKDWLSNLTNDDDREKKLNEWKNTLMTIVQDRLNSLMNGATYMEISGYSNEKGNIENIFTLINHFRNKIRNIL